MAFLNLKKISGTKGMMFWNQKPILGKKILKTFLKIFKSFIREILTINVFYIILWFCYSIFSTLVQEYAKQKELFFLFSLRIKARSKSFALVLMLSTQVVL